MFTEMKDGTSLRLEASVYPEIVYPKGPMAEYFQHHLNPLSHLPIRFKANGQPFAPAVIRPTGIDIVIVGEPHDVFSRGLGRYAWGHKFVSWEERWKKGDNIDSHVGVFDREGRVVALLEAYTLNASEYGFPSKTTYSYNDELANIPYLEIEEPTSLWAGSQTIRSLMEGKTGEPILKEKIMIPEHDIPGYSARFYTNQINHYGLTTGEVRCEVFGDNTKPAIISDGAIIIEPGGNIRTNINHYSVIYPRDGGNPIIYLTDEKTMIENPSGKKAVTHKRMNVRVQ